jgi:two-component sensor histidine kinase
VRRAALPPGKDGRAMAVRWRVGAAKETGRRCRRWFQFDGSRHFEAIWRIVPGSAKAYALAIGLVGIATAARWGLGFFTGYLQAFTTFYPAVLFAALLGGAGPGILATLLGGFICWWDFLSPYRFLLPLKLADAIDLATFFIAAFMIVWATDHYRRLTKRLRDEENFRKLAVDELAHRLGNKVATIQAIINFQLRDQPEIRQDINSALTALRATDNLIMATQGQGAHIADVVSAEMAPYDASRVSYVGRDFLLPPTFALVMSLLMHELATNAAKYGALSNSTGALSIEWTLQDGRLNLTWAESGGPPVTAPSSSGFGTRLFQRALEQFEGKIIASFPPTGFLCRLSVLVPDQSTDTPTDDPRETSAGVSSAAATRPSLSPGC